MNLSCGKERGMGIVSLYILASLKKKPQSGYDLLKGIGEKTEGRWIPSKGTLYPIITHMEKDSLIRVNKLGKRGKKVFELTKKGKVMLANANKFDHYTREKLTTFRNLLTEVFGEHISSYGELMLDIKDLVFTIEPSKKIQVAMALKKCLAELKKLK